MDWIIGIQRAVDYIENNLTETIDYEEAAKQCYSSSYHFQRVFSILCGFTLGEYIRNRRLTLAGRELATTNAKVIDVAMKYGYESPDSFSKAFHKFHGILPSQAKNNGSNLKSFSRLVLKFSLEGGTTMKYRVENKPALTLIGYKRRFNGTPYDSLRQHQEGDFFASTRAYQWMLKGMTNDKLSDYCVLSGFDDDGYDFYISVTTDDYERNNLYNSEVTGIDFMERFGFEEIVIPERTYLIFETEKTKMPIPEYFDMRKQISAEWLANDEYQITNAPELAVYHWGIVGGCPERTIEIWIPIEKK
ncbi:MAG: AraC family transcriptional regulator [Clostridia bacterium]|nr:AraC family transcriptional regulator [Clostridia bacterium]